MRLDAYLTEIMKKYESRTKAKEAVERGEVLVGGKVAKPSFSVTEKDVITFAEGSGAFVSNGAFKLLKAFESFDFDLSGKTVADVGASTGGFTQCALMHGAKKVYAIDVGENLLHPSLREDERVIRIENFNARFLNADTLGEKADAVISDVSFISLTYLLNGFSLVMKDGREAVVLVKPQFECGRKYLSKNGVVTDKKARAAACIAVTECAKANGLGAINFTFAPIREGKNVEFLLHLKKGAEVIVTEEFINSVCINV
ncbi:MAG: TlyA family RNA methyltransferase [Clostridia bacterium]|nr:TlyA family RNA methyltransferase [Clostridia bacterium]